uniref:Eukaryotic translation initiation factor 4ea n=1 Tax=Oryzias latipes TaxID=8090 RepID=A0A3B3HG83_ORYLA
MFLLLEFISWKKTNNLSGFFFYFLCACNPLVRSPKQESVCFYRWTLWFFKNDKSKTWQANLRLISTFDTVEDFWALYNHIQLSSNLMSGCDYSLFKDGIEPMWEDERNRRGGRWLITLSKQQRKMDLDRFWLETVQSSITRASYFKVALKAVIKKQMMPINSEKMGIGINEEKMAGINRNHRLALLVSVFAQGLLSVKPLIKSEKRM